jgi:hypothetical protein
MPLVSRLTPDSAVAVGALGAIGVIMIYTNTVPNITDIRSAPAHDATVETDRKHAAILSAGWITVVSLIARDLNVWVISGLALVGMDYLVKHNNATNPHTGKIEGGADAAGNATISALPTYVEAM